MSLLRRGWDLVLTENNRRESFGEAQEEMGFMYYTFVPV
jgi:hypothetical protein